MPFTAHAPILVFERDGWRVVAQVVARQSRLGRHGGPALRSPQPVGRSLLLVAMGQLRTRSRRRGAECPLSAQSPPCARHPTRPGGAAHASVRVENVGSLQWGLRKKPERESASPWCSAGAFRLRSPHRDGVRSRTADPTVPRGTIWKPRGLWWLLHAKDGARNRAQVSEMTKHSSGAKPESSRDPNRTFSVVGALPRRGLRCAVVGQLLLERRRPAMADGITSRRLATPTPPLCLCFVAASS